MAGGILRNRNQPFRLFPLEYAAAVSHNSVGGTLKSEVALKKNCPNGYEVDWSLMRQNEINTNSMIAHTAPSRTSLHVKLSQLAVDCVCACLWHLRADAVLPPAIHPQLLQHELARLKNSHISRHISRHNFRHISRIFHAIFHVTIMPV